MPFQFHPSIQKHLHHDTCAIKLLRTSTRVFVKVQETSETNGNLCSQIKYGKTAPWYFTNKATCGLETKAKWYNSLKVCTCLFVIPFQAGTIV